MAFHEVADGGHRIFYRVLGQPKGGTRVLLTMGLGGDHSQWEPQSEYLAAQDGLEVCVFDNRGAGFSDAPPGRWTTRCMAKDALSLLDHLGWDENVHLVGVSMGGMITQELALLDLDRFRSMTLLATIAGGLHSLFYFGMSLPTGVRHLVTTFTASTGRAQLDAGLRVLYPERVVLERGRELAGAIVRRARANKAAGMPRPKLSSVARQALAVMTHSVSPERLALLGKHFGESALVLTGDDDILVHSRNSHRLKEMLGPDARLVVVPAAGHGVSEQHPEEVNRAIMETIQLGQRSRL